MQHQVLSGSHWVALGCGLSFPRSSGRWGKGSKGRSEPTQRSILEPPAPA